MKNKPCLEVDGSAFYVFIKEAGEFGIVLYRYVGIILVKLMKTYRYKVNICIPQKRRK